MPQKIVYNKSFNKWIYNIKDVRNIYKKAKYNNSWVRSKILLLVKAKLGFQILAVIRGKMRFQALFN